MTEDKNTSFINEFLRLAKNRYVMVLLFFVIWILFFDQRNAILVIKKYLKLRELNQKELTTKQNILNTKTELNLLKSNKETIEQYARENYYMKKDNEDLFIVTKDN